MYLINGAKAEVKEIEILATGIRRRDITCTLEGLVILVRKRYKIRVRREENGMKTNMIGLFWQVSAVAFTMIIVGMLTVLSSIKRAVNGGGSILNTFIARWAVVIGTLMFITGCFVMWHYLNMELALLLR